MILTKPAKMLYSERIKNSQIRNLLTVSFIKAVIDLYFTKTFFKVCFAGKNRTFCKVFLEGCCSFTTRVCCKICEAARQWHTQNPLNYLRWRFLKKWLTA